MNFIYNLLWETIVLNEIKNSLAYYKIDKALSSEVTYDGSSEKISYLFDQTFNENHAKQNFSTIKPTLCNVANRVNNRYFIEFSGRSVLFSDIDLTQPSSSSKITNFFVVYRLKGYHGSIDWFRNCFFREGDYFVGFSTLGDLIVSNTVTGRYIKIGTANDAVAPYKNKANAGKLNKWCSLSVHWNGNSPQTNKSSVYCNGVKLVNFTSNYLNASGKMQIGSSNDDDSIVFSTFVMRFAGTGMFKGDIAFFMFKQGIMDERTILLHHKLFCEKWYNINANPIKTVMSLVDLT